MTEPKGQYNLSRDDVNNRAELPLVPIIKNLGDDIDQRRPIITTHPIPVMSQDIWQQIYRWENRAVTTEDGQVFYDGY